MWVLCFLLSKTIVVTLRGCVRRLRNRLAKRDTFVVSTSAGQSVGGSVPEKSELVRHYPESAVPVKRPATYKTISKINVVSLQSS